MVYGYCVTTVWFKDYGEYILKRGWSASSVHLNLAATLTNMVPGPCSKYGVWADAPSSQVYHRLYKTDDGQYLSRTTWDTMKERDTAWKGRIAEYTCGLVFGICDDSDYKHVQNLFLNIEYSEKLMEIFRTHDGPRWYWCYSSQDLEHRLAITQPWTCQLGSQVVKLRPFEIVDDPRVRFG